MKKQILSSVLLLATLLSAQLAMTVSAEESAENVILISPRPQTQTETGAERFLRNQYEQTAGMYSYDGVAGQLNSIGVLLGSGSGFDLENLPDRQQACVMVVRMRGEEAAALEAYHAGEITCPFTDVTDEWVKPYLAWVYEKDIAKGIGDSKFGNRICSADEYVTFMLRALGYSVTWEEEEDTDVLFADVLDHARGIHLWDERLACEPEFNRGVMAAVTYQTLAANVKGTDDRLLSVLAASGAIAENAAQPILSLYDRVDAAAALELSAHPVYIDGLKLSGYMTQDEYYASSVFGAADGDITESAYNGMSFDIGLDFTEGKEQLALTGEVTALISDMDLVVPMGMWIDNGTVYIDVMGDKVKTDLADSDEMASVMAAFGDLSLMVSDTGYQYYTVTDVKTQVLDGTEDNGFVGTVIVYDTSAFMWPMIVSYLGLEDISESAVLGAIAATNKYIDGNGILSGVYNGMYAQVFDTNVQTGITESTEVLIESTVSYTAWGDDVTLTFPDFSLFEEAPADAE